MFGYVLSRVRDGVRVTVGYTSSPSFLSLTLLNTSMIRDTLDIHRYQLGAWRSSSLPSHPPSVLFCRCVAAEIERIGLIESGDLDEDEAHGDPVPAITKVCSLCLTACLAVPFLLLCLLNDPLESRVFHMPRL